MNKFNFTDRKLAKLPAPTGKQNRYVYDSRVHGLAFSVSAGGRRNFLLYVKVKGRPERITIGRFPDLTIEQARAKAHQLNADIAMGGNPADQRRAVSRQSTLGDLFEQYLERYLKLHTKRWQDVSDAFELYFGGWRSRFAADIRPTDVAHLHAKLGRERGHYASNRAMEILRATFNKATTWGYEGTNPALGIVKFKEVSRDRFLSAAELPAFFQALAAEQNSTTRDYFLTLLLTGARSGNVRAMRWDQLELSAGIWKIPNTKSGEPQTVVLVMPMIELLEGRPRMQDCPWVFEGGGRTGHIGNVQGAWARVVKHAGLADLRVHDLRRTLGSWQAAVGSSLPIIGKSLGHTSLKATQIYSRLELAPVRASVERATTALLEAANKPRQVKEKLKVPRE